MRKKIIINTANFKKGGALQMAASFVHEASKVTAFDFCIILGRETSKIIDIKAYKLLDHLQFTTLAIHPSDSLTALFRFRKALSRIEKTYIPDAVITIFGPCYWKPRALHIMGFANGYLLYEDSYFFKVWDGWKHWKYKLKKQLHHYLLKAEADFYWTETEDSRQRLARFLVKPLTHFIVSSNNCSNLFREFPFEPYPGLPEKVMPRLIYISSYYYHKGFELMALVLKQLEQEGTRVEMIVTIEETEFEKLFKDVKNVINLGNVNPKFCPWLYQQSDIVFAPTLLEIFSAIYPEAMYMQKPIVTTDLPFAHNICGDAALYFDPASAEDAAGKIQQVLNDASLRNRLIANGLKQLEKFDLPEERFRKILDRLLAETG